MAGRSATGLRVFDVFEICRATPALQVLPAGAAVPVLRVLLTAAASVPALGVLPAATASVPALRVAALRLPAATATVLALRVVSAAAMIASAAVRVLPAATATVPAARALAGWLVGVRSKAPAVLPAMPVAGARCVGATSATAAGSAAPAALAQLRPTLPGSIHRREVLDHIHCDLFVAQNLPVVPALLLQHIHRGAHKTAVICAHPCRTRLWRGNSASPIPIGNRQIQYAHGGHDWLVWRLQSLRLAAHQRHGRALQADGPSSLSPTTSMHSGLLNLCADLPQYGHPPHQPNVPTNLTSAQTAHVCTPKPTHANPAHKRMHARPRMQLATTRRKQVRMYVHMYTFTHTCARLGGITLRIVRT